jgi:tetratricopeptide (TPR) repeat protein/HEAT repeat protein
MASDTSGGFHSLPDPYWTAGDYVRFADHPSADVRLWALGRLAELGLEIPDQTLRRRLEDADLTVATTAAELVGRLEVTSLADVLHARLERAEDAIGSACAASLARLGDRRVVNLIRQRSHLPLENRDPRIWLALAELKGPEAQEMLLQTFAGFSSPTGATTASVLSKALLLADPERGIPQVVGRWAGQAEEGQADALLHDLLLLCAFPEGPEALRAALEPDQEPPEVPLPREILDGLADLLPLGPIRDIRKLCRRRKWTRAMTALIPLAGPLASRAPKEADAVLSVLLIRALAEHGEAIHRSAEKSRDSVGLLLLALDQLAGAARAASLTLPETPDGQLHWLLSDAALPHPEGQAAVTSRLVAAGPTEGWERMCMEIIEQRAAQAAMAASLLGAWGSEAAIPVLLGALVTGDDVELPAAAGEALANIGAPAVDPVLKALASAEDPGVLAECLDVCIRLASRRAVMAIAWRFEELFVRVPDALLDAVGRIGAREFVEPLRAEVREGERQAEDTFAFLCDLHGIADGRLPAIRDRQNTEKSRAAESDQDVPGLPEEHIDLALQCNGCRRTYTYPVKAVYVDPDIPEAQSPQPFIKDRIRCKGCGREDDYILAPAAHFALTARLILLLDRMEKKGPEAAAEGPLRLMRLGLSDGRRLNPREARRDYEARLAQRSDDPGLHIGYANILRFLDEGELAEAAYRRALELDPWAVEGHAGLGRLAEERGDLANALSAYQQCLALARKARFYHVKDRREFVRGIEAARDGIQAVRATRLPDPVPAQARLDSLVAQDRGGPKVGRNAPCPCGSGRKYKKCCLPKESPVPSSQASAPDKRLRDRLVEYVTRSLPRAEVDRALREFFAGRFDLPDRRLQMVETEAEADFGAYLEWLIHDFRLSTGQTPIARFLAERGRSLPADERAILEEWQDAVVGLHEVMDLEPGKSLTLRDVFTGETFQVREVRGSLSAARWDLLSNRVICVQGERQLSGSVTAFDATERDKLVQHVSGRYAAYRRQHPEASYRDFFRAEPLIFRRYAEQMIRGYRPPALHTEEGHPVMLGRLQYEIRDLSRLLAALLTAADFEETTDRDDPAGTRHFAWLRTGPAQRWVKEGPRPEHGVMVTTQRMVDPQTPGVTSLATLTVEGDRLAVEAFSAERLAWVKGRLAELVGNAVNLRADVVEDVWRKIGATPPSDRSRKGPPEVPPEVGAQFLGPMLHRHYKTWVDDAIPALEGTTPRRAAKDPRLRPKLIQLLREHENQQDRARQRGEIWYDIGWIWQELGISRHEA